MGAEIEVGPDRVCDGGFESRGSSGILLSGVGGCAHVQDHVLVRDCTWWFVKIVHDQAYADECSV